MNNEFVKRARISRNIQQIFICRFCFEMYDKIMKILNGLVYRQFPSILSEQLRCYSLKSRRPTTGCVVND